MEVVVHQAVRQAAPIEPTDGAFQLAEELEPVGVAAVERTAIPGAGCHVIVTVRDEEPEWTRHAMVRTTAGVLAPGAGLQDLTPCFGAGRPSHLGRSSDWGPDPMGRQWAPADLLSTMRTLRMHLLGLDVADVQGRTLGQVVDTYPFDGGGELEMIVLRLRRFGERRMLPVSELRLDNGRIVVPFSQHQVEDAPGLSTGRHADEDPWRAKTYWYYEEYAVARA